MDRQGTDTISLHIDDMPTPFPEMKYAGTLKLEYGVQWCQEALGVKEGDIEVIKIGWGSPLGTFRATNALATIVEPNGS